MLNVLYLQDIQGGDLEAPASPPPFHSFSAQAGLSRGAEISAAMDEASAGIDQAPSNDGNRQAMRVVSTTGDASEVLYRSATVAVLHHVEAAVAMAQELKVRDGIFYCWSIVVIHTLCQTHSETSK